MVFKASKERRIHEPERVGRGTPIIPSMAIAAAYRRELKSLCYLMIDDYNDEVNKWLGQKQTKAFFAMDSVDSSFNNLMAKLKLKWSRIFSKIGSKAAENFLRQVEVGATSATFASLKVAGLEAPKAPYSRFVEQTLEMSQSFNTTLITNVGADIHEKVYNSVMLSLTSPNPEEQGVSGIQKTLREIKHFSAKRVDLIAKDQTSKLYCALSDERMRQNGVEEFEWAHSGGGKEKRESHVRLNGMRFKLDDKRLWQVNGVLKLKKPDIGPPGWAIHCHCRKIPII